MIQRLAGLATGKSILVAVAISTLLAIPYFGLVFKNQLSHGALLDQTFHFSPQDVHRILESYGPVGRMQYFRGELIDLVFIPLLALTIALVISYAFKSRSWRTRFAMVPLLAGLLNTLKVLLILPLILTYPHESTTLVWIANAINMLKDLAMAAAIPLLLAALRTILVKQIIRIIIK